MNRFNITKHYVLTAKDDQLPCCHNTNDKFLMWLLYSRCVLGSTRLMQTLVFRKIFRLVFFLFVGGREGDRVGKEIWTEEMDAHR